jgi:hypothetical protein
VINSRSKVAIFSNIPLWIDRHPEAVELAWRLTAENKDVMWISCNEALASCPANPNHSLALCRVCKQQNKRTTGKLLPPGAIIESYDRIRQPKLDIEFPQNWLDLLQYYYFQMPIGALVASQLSDDFSDIAISDEYVQRRGGELITSGIYLYEWFRQLIADKNISQVYAWNGRRSSDGPALYAARSMKIDYKSFISDEHGTVRIEDEFFVQTNKGYMNRFLSSVETPITAGELTIVQNYFDRLRFGSPQDRNFRYFGQENKEGFVKNNCNKPILAIFASSLWENVGNREMSISDCLNPFDEFEKLNKVCNDPDLKSKWHIVVRFHPNQSNSGPVEKSLIDGLVRNCLDIEFIMPTSKISSYSLLDNANVVLTFASTIGIEAAWCQKPSVLYGRALHENAGFCYHFTDYECLKGALLDMDLKPTDTSLVARYITAVLSSNTNFQYVKTSKYGSSIGSTYLDLLIVPRKVFLRAKNFFSKDLLRRLL